MSNIILIPLFVYVLWVSIIYFLLTIMRAPTIWGAGKDSPEAERFKILEPKASANLSNQFEWPVLYFAVSIILIARPELYDTSQLWLAYIFVLGRVIHSLVHIFMNNIKLRGMVFNINFLAVLSMWIILILNMFTG